MSLEGKPSFFEWLGMDPDSDECRACDYIEVHGAPDRGRLMELTISSGQLTADIVMTDAAQWVIPELGVQQESFAHAGFCGSIAGLLTKVSRDVSMMRRGYPQEQQPAFDAFLQRIDSILFQGGGQLGSLCECNLRVRDPSGLSAVVDASDSTDLSWVVVTDFDRTFMESDELGVVGLHYTVIPADLQLSSAAAVAGLVARASMVVCLSGAGISVESGIPPFRSNIGDSIWGSFSAEMMTVQGFNTNVEVAKYWWSMKHSLLPKVNEAKPNAAHNFFGYLESKGKLSAVITQNIDTLHQKGGVSVDRVLELHGHMRGLICSDKRGQYNPLPYRAGLCGFAMDESEALDKDYFAGTPLPLCPLCSCPLRTETVMFNQPLPEGHFSAAVEAVSAADLMFVIGSSLIVEPANSLPDVALRLGIPIVMINLDSTHYDHYATALVRGPAGAFLSSVRQELEYLTSGADRVDSIGHHGSKS